jgi:pre-mRNA cleavage complex 2 protein Pcf11
MNAKETAAAEAAKRDAELRAKFVPVPPGQESIFPTCSICKEQIDQGFIDGDEEYIWTNAVRDEKDGRVCIFYFILSLRNAEVLPAVISRNMPR